MRHGLIAILLSVLLFPTMVIAQSLDASLTSANSFTLSTSPQYPLPYGQVSISALSSTLDLTNATMIVSLAGKSIYQGSVQPVSIPLKGAGSVANVLVTISSGGGSYTQSVFIQPQDVAIIAEPLSSAPVLYPGKPLTPLEGSVRIVALAGFRDASGKTLDPASLSYAWTVDGTRIANSSGIGKQVIIVASPLQYRNREVSVVVQSQSGNLVGGASLSLTPTEPTVRIYKNDPLLGILFDHALSGTYAITSSEDTLYGVPYSFPTGTGDIALRWFLNGTSAEKGQSLTLRPTGTGTGSASLSLTASVGVSTQTSANLSLSFGSKTSGNFFGL